LIDYLDSIDKILVDSNDRLFLSSEEEEAYKSYVEEENYRQNKFSLNDFNAKAIAKRVINSIAFKTE